MAISKYVVLSTGAGLVAAIGCANDPKSESPMLGHAPVRMTVDTSRGTLSGVFPATLTLTAGAEARVEFGVSAGSGNDAWGLLGEVSLDDLKEGSGSLTVVHAEPLSTGKCSVDGPSSSSGNKAHGVSGSVSFTSSAGHIRGTADVEPSESSATFEGELAVQCWVPQSALPASTQGGLTPDEGFEAPLVEDRELATEACAPLRKWRK